MTHDISGSGRLFYRAAVQALLFAVTPFGVSGCARDSSFDEPGLLEEPLSFAGSLGGLRPGDTRSIDTRAGDGRVEYSVVTWASWQPVQTAFGCPLPCGDTDIARLDMWSDLWMNQYALRIANRAPQYIETSFSASLECINRYGPSSTWDVVAQYTRDRADVSDSLGVEAGEEVEVALDCPEIGADESGATDVLVDVSLFDNPDDPWQVSDRIWPLWPG